MGRLIDAEKCPCKTCGISYCHENCNKYYEWLNGCDYDVEKVVAEIEKLSIHVDISNPTSPIRHEVCAIHPIKAIEIVRKGGVE